MKILNWILFLIFLLSAALQFNDPDAIIWMLMWGAAAAACLLFGIGKGLRAFPLFVGIIALIWAAILVPSVVETTGDIRWSEVFVLVSMSNITVEWVREIGGLLIIAVWMGVLCRQSPKKPAE